MTTRVTIVVATRNRRKEPERSLAHHECPAILVDNGSADGTPAFVRQRFPSVEVVELGENRGAPARNVGVRRASTPYVAFADGPCHERSTHERPRNRPASTRASPLSR
ncbi:glycosyltransferase family 2 protein [Microtetraspora malaysiensis]|uniref:glycosyltransferase family 2 protein n=1 Tax=Microtetraspora malaysiensis TaxID=161358 RepID=UPI003D8E49C6